MNILGPKVTVKCNYRWENHMNTFKFGLAE